MDKNSLFAAAEAALAEKRRKFDEEQSYRREQIFQKLPEARDLENRISSGFASFAEAIFDGATQEDLDRCQEENLRLQQRQRALLQQAGFEPDALDPKFFCPKCRDSGYVEYERCSCFKREYSRLLIENSNLAGTYGQMTLDKFRTDYYGSDEKRMGQMLDIMHRYISSFGNGSRNFLFTGVPGCGKTFLSCAVGYALIDKGFVVCYTPVQDMIAEFENEKFGKNGGADTSVYTGCDLLIIDDLGTEFQTPFSDSVIYNVVNNRINMQKPMIISTNYSIDDMENVYHDRLRSRLAHEFAVVTFPSVDIRNEKRIRKVNGK